MILTLATAFIVKFPIAPVFASDVIEITLFETVLTLPSAVVPANPVG